MQFATAQKHEDWDKKSLKKLQVSMLLSTIFVYICHIVSSPFLRFVENQNVLLAINTFELVLLLISITCFVKMHLVNGSWTVVKLMFGEMKIRTYIFLFWLVRHFIIEISKGQILYSFVASFHSIMLFGADAWYACDREVLIANMIMYFVMLLYEFLVSISPVRPLTPSWTFMNVEITPNSLSRSNYVNLFVIFFDAFIVLLYDVNRSKYMMLKKKQKRAQIEPSSSKIQMLKRLWGATALFSATILVCYAIEIGFGALSRSGNTRLGLILVEIFGVLVICCYCMILYHSTSNGRRIFRMLMRERRVCFIILYLAILFYVDIIYLGWNTVRMLYPVIAMAAVSFDFIVMYFPRRLALLLMSVCIIINLWNIFNFTFMKTDCKQKLLDWGIFGEKLSYCTIKRIVYQSILSLIVSAAFQIYSGRIDNLFFCNATVYRSTGTIYKDRVNGQYVSSIKKELAEAKERVSARIQQNPLKKKVQMEVLTARV